MTPRRRHTPSWIKAGDSIALALIAAILAAAFFSHGLAREGMWRFAGEAGCVLLGIWALASWAAGRWEENALRPARRLLLLLAFVLAVGFVQLMPLPANVTTSISSIHASHLDAIEAAGIPAPDRLSITLAPEEGRRAWHQLFASLLFFAGVGTLLTRRRNIPWLAALAALFAVLEGLIGVARFFLEGAFRVTGAIYNPNHHATAVVMCLPLFFALVIYWSRTSKRFSAPLAGGRNPLLLLMLLGCIAGLSWVFAFSRGSLFFGSIVLAGWLAWEWRHHREMATGMPSRWRTFALFSGVIAAVVIVAALFAPAFRDRAFDQRTLGANGRVAIWQATVKAIGEAPLTGLGPGGTRYAIDRHSPIALTREPIHAHNDWLQWVAELGLPAACIAGGLLLWLLLGYRRDTAANRDLIHGSELAIIRRAAFAGLLIVLLHSLTDFPLRVPAVGFTALMLAGIALSGRGRRHDESTK